MHRPVPLCGDYCESPLGTRSLATVDPMHLRGPAHPTGFRNCQGAACPEGGKRWRMGIDQIGTTASGERLEGQCFA